MTATQQFSDQYAALSALTETTSGIDFATTRAGFVAPLTDLGLMSFAGADAVSFLHRQLTNDVEHLDPLHARLAGYCTAQGRLLATFLMWKSGEQILLQLPLDIQPALQKRLQMYVLRDKVKLTDASADWILLGLGGAAATEVLAQWFAPMPAEPYAKVDNEHGSLIRVADAFDAPRYQWITTADIASKVWPILRASLKLATKDIWHLADINAGVPQITTATQEKFVAQMVNFEILGGVNFKKGCYPGQEVIARSHYLGKNKRRMLAAAIDLLNSDVAAVAGTELYADADPSQPCGMIVNAERRNGDLVDCLVSIRIPVPNEGAVHLGSPQGPSLHFKPLPYALPEENERP